MQPDIVERLRRKVFHGPTMEATHTKTLEWQAADMIDNQQAEIEGLRMIIKDLERHLEQAEWIIDKYREEEDTK